MFQDIPVIALEEHYWDTELISHIGGAEAVRSRDLLMRLYDVADLRLRAMDDQGIDRQVLSHGAPSAQKLAAGAALDVTRATNDRLAEVIARHPTRFSGFAALPTILPEKAADELERAVKDLGFKGAMIHGLTDGLFLDDKRFWPIFERAESLDVPLYLHPSFPHPEVQRVYYGDYIEDFPQVIRAAWGYTVETGTQAIRLVLSGVFEKHPGVKIILGHLGETLPFLLWRINEALSRPGHKPLNFREQFCSHFYVTTSGNFSTPAFICTVLEMGIDRIMFSVDYPFVANKSAMDWVNNLQISTEDKAKVLSGTAQRLLRL